MAMVAWCFAAEQLHPLERLVIMNDPHPLCFRTALKHWRQMRKSWYVAFFRLPRLPERILTVNGGAIVRRMFGGVQRRRTCWPSTLGRSLSLALRRRC